MNLPKQLTVIGIFIVTLTTTTASRLSKSCQVNLKVINGDFEVECKEERTGVYVDVICRNNNWTDFSDVKLNVPFIKELSFSNCSFPETLNLVNVINALGVNSSRLGFKDLRTTPSRHTFQGLTVSHMTFSSSNLTELPFDMLYGTSGIKSLVIMNSNVRQFPKKFFMNWSKDLDALHLLMNNLGKINRNDFAGLDNVSTMILYSNEITEIEAGVFDHLTRLSVLDLAHNLLRTLPSGIFRHLVALDRLHLSQNPFDELPSDLLAGIDSCHLTHFRMNYINGSLKTLQNGFFKNLKDLRDVQLQDSQLESLPSDLFAGASELVDLNLRDNHLRSLPPGLFSSLNKLEKLELANNQIDNLPAGIFEELLYLDNLDISYNNLTSLSSDVFSGLNAITTFNASHNYLKDVDDNLCQSLRNVEVIDLSFNQLTFQTTRTYLHIERTSVFMTCQKLRNIYLSNNKATEILVDFAYRKYIDLSNNHLSEITARDIEILSPIGTVDLRNNQISRIDLKELPSAVARYTALGNKLSYRNLKIMLGNNPLHCDCHLIDFINYWRSKDDSTFRQFVKLIAGDVDDGSMKCASPAEFKNRDISSIRPEELNCPLNTDLAEDDACSNTCICREYPAKQVLAVDCSYRNLTQLPTTIANPRNWSIELNMSHNALRETPSIGKHHLENVTSLDLSNNEISTVTKDIFSASLVDLKLDHNKLSRLDASVVEHLSNDKVLRRLTLHGNKWICDCQSRDFYSFVQKRALAFKLFEVECSETKDKLYAITMSELCNGLMLTVVVVSLTVAIVAIIVGSVLALHYRRNQEIKVLPYTKNWYIKLLTNNELGKHNKYNAFVNSTDKKNDLTLKEKLVVL